MVQDITFGIEIECGIPAAAFAANNIRPGSRHRGNQVEGLPIGWKAEYDGSVSFRDAVAVEIVSPVLRGEAGLREAILVIETIRAWGGKVNSSCGFHIHIGMTAPDAVARLVHMAANYEKALFATTGTKAREQGNWCKPVSGRFQNLNFKAAAIASWGGPAADRYHALNISNLATCGKRTVEFRLFAGTLNSTKIAGYVRMCVGLAERALESKRTVSWQHKARSGKPVTGRTELHRMFKLLGWAAGFAGRRVYGDLAGAGIPTHEMGRKTLRKLAAQYDAYGTPAGDPRPDEIR